MHFIFPKIEAPGPFLWGGVLHLDVDIDVDAPNNTIDIDVDAFGNMVHYTLPFAFPFSGIPCTTTPTDGGPIWWYP